jgi:hypothetical protein
MLNIRNFSAGLLIIICSVCINYNANAQLDIFQNGDFETGDFTGWTVIQNINSGGDWFVYSGVQTPIGLSTVLPPPDGIFAAITDQGDPSSQVLYQDIVVPTIGVQCSAVIYYINRGGEIGIGSVSTEATDNYTNRGSEVGSVSTKVDGEGVFINGPDLSQLNGPNQQARIDIMDPAADPFDVGSGVLLNIFQTNPGDPAELDYTPLNFDLSQFAGSTVRFRVAEVDNQGVFNFSIDNVQCLGATNIPTLSEWGMISAAAGLGLIGLFFAIRRKKAMV